LSQIAIGHRTTLSNNKVWTWSQKNFKTADDELNGCLRWESNKITSDRSRKRSQENHIPFLVLPNGLAFWNVSASSGRSTCLKTSFNLLKDGPPWVRQTWWSTRHFLKIGTFDRQALLMNIFTLNTAFQHVNTLLRQI